MFNTSRSSNPIFNSDTEEVLIFYEQSRHGWCPKLYGTFEGGRIEELLEGHTLTADDFDVPAIRSEVAKAYVNLHSMKYLPLPHKMDVILGEATQYNKPTAEVVKRIKELGIDPSFTTLDIAGNISWLVGEMGRVNSRLVFSHWDTNYLNIWVRDRPKDGQRKVVIYDFEMVHRTYRAIDLGFLFVNQMIDWDDRQDKRSGYQYPTLEKRRHFLSAYQAEVERLATFDDFDPDGRDSVDHLLVESLLGSMFLCNYSVSWMSVMWGKFLAEEPSFLALLPFLMSVYPDIRREYIEVTNVHNN
jgi:thiamine kinase-like enzyme